MKYHVISADCHIDFPWLPEDLFKSRCSPSLRDRMPFVEETSSGRFWTSKNGARFGLQNGMGSAGRRYVPGEIHRSDRMAEQGLYDDGEKASRDSQIPICAWPIKLVTAFKVRCFTVF